MSGTIRRDLEFRSPVAPPITPAEDALAAAKLVQRQERAVALLKKGVAPGVIAMQTSLQVRDVLRLKMELREAQREAGKALGAKAKGTRA